MNSKNLENMLQLQDTFNKQVALNWKEKDFDWNLAILIESAEAIDSLQWKWWKKQQNDFENLQIELVDIWHFILSLVIMYDNKDAKRTLEVCFCTLKTVFPYSEDNARVQQLIYELKALMNLASNKITNIEDIILKFTYICKLANLSNDKLYEKYIIKNVLNKLRQEEGYNEGNYIKIWNGVEDNKAIQNLIPNEYDFDSLYKIVKNYYQTKIKLKGE